MLRGAQRLSARQSGESGDDRRAREKVRALVAPRFGASRATRGSRAVRSLDTCADMATLFRDLLPARARTSMTDINPRAARARQEYRQAVRELCARFDSDYWQEVDERAGYPEAFVKALTDAGWLAALIPDRVRRRRTLVTEASVILEEINRSGANSGACHAQMYIMGTLLRHGRRSRSSAICPRSRRASCGCSRSPSPSRRPAPTRRSSRPSPSGGRSLRRQRPEGVDLAHPAFRPDAAARAHHAARAR